MDDENKAILDEVALAFTLGDSPPELRSVPRRDYSTRCGFYVNTPKAKIEVSEAAMRASMAWRRARRGIRSWRDVDDACFALVVFDKVLWPNTCGVHSYVRPRYNRSDP